jgi:hypothetical protein
MDAVVAAGHAQPDKLAYPANAQFRAAHQIGSAQPGVLAQAICRQGYALISTIPESQAENLQFRRHVDKP